MKPPPQLRAYRARPLRWVVAGVVLVALVLSTEAADAHQDRVSARTALAVDGEVGDGYAGTSNIPVVYTNPVTDQEIAVTVYRWSGPMDLAPGDPIALEVDPYDPGNVVVAGDRRPYLYPGPAPSVLIPLLAFGLRARSVRRSLRLVDRVAPAPVDAAEVPSDPHRWRRRRLVHVGPACTLAAGVLVGSVVTILTLRRASSFGPPNGWAPVDGEVVEIGADSVDVTYWVDGQDRTETARSFYPDDYTVGRRYPLRYDPDRPGRVWLSNETYMVAFPVLVGWLPAAVAGLALIVVVRRSRRARARAAHGPWSRLELWYVPGPGLPRPGPVLVAGIPEPRELVDLLDANGETFPATLRLRTPPDSGAPYRLGARTTGGSLLRRARTPT